MLTESFTIVLLVLKKTALLTQRSLWQADTGALMTKGTGANRSPMTPWCALLQRWHQAKLYRGPLSPDSQRLERRNDQCVWCQAWQAVTREERSLPLVAGALPDMYACAGCSLIWHASCASELTQLTEHDAAGLGMRNGMCPVCFNLQPDSAARD